jgi:hypothetical protein
VTIGVLHMTESDPGTGDAVCRYLIRIGAESHYVIDPSDGFLRQLVDLSSSSKALRNLAGGVETNRREGGVIQVEIVGRSADVGGYSDEWYAVLRQQLQAISAEAGIAYEFRPDHTRLTFAEWLDPSLTGWLGHCHVPENDHWDPGTLDYTRLIFHPTTETDMTPDEIRTARLADGTTINDRLIWTNEAANRATAAAERAAAAAQEILNRALLPQADLSTFSTAQLLAELQRRL